MPLKSLLICFVLISTGQNCIAQGRDFFLELGLHNGGDELPTDEMLPQHITRVEAGGFVSASLGTVFKITDRLAFTPGLGIVYTSSKIALLNFLFDETSWRVHIINLPVLYQFDYWHIGTGISFHYKPVLSTQSEDYSYTWEFDNSVGSILKLGYRFNDTHSLDLQYTNIDYTYQESFKVSGDNIALLWRIHFPP